MLMAEDSNLLKKDAMLISEAGNLLKEAAMQTTEDNLLLTKDVQQIKGISYLFNEGLAKPNPYFITFKSFIYGKE